MTDIKTRKTLVDYILDTDYDRYNELLSIAEQAKAEAKAAHKTERKPRGPLTNEQKARQTESKIAKLQAKLAALMGEVTED